MRILSFLTFFLLAVTGQAIAEQSVSQNEPYTANADTVTNADTVDVQTIEKTANSPLIPDLKGWPLRQHIIKTFKKWAKVQGEDNCRMAALEYMGLIFALAKDDQLDVKMRRELDAQIKYRLKALEKTLKIYNERHRKERLAEQRLAEQKPSGKKVQPNTVGKPADNNGILAQQDFSEILGEDSKTSNYEKEGEELVELIQKTIMTNTWDVNGGPGTIMYYGQQKALVISQTAEAHEEIAALLEQLRRAGN